MNISNIPLGYAILPLAFALPLILSGLLSALGKSDKYSFNPFLLLGFSVLLPPIGWIIFLRHLYRILRLPKEEKEE
ncbi:hypothetical protein CWE09_01570 [Aliidiomarina minuta]|uniref:Uncharacterized protein n=1 Tax=Aliidiomarina minuta TaxID=880057 RepID=A0A432W5Y6_9GAMM|nr:hypothetical protein [Aliidiomarina minuta]RUO25452.1 hypothetical protein CWE09_01570 [Aliidiomarina minuta]